MPTVIQRLTKGHYCYACHKLIKKGEGAKRWDYADKKMYRHLGKCPTEK